MVRVQVSRPPWTRQPSLWLHNSADLIPAVVAALHEIVQRLAALRAACIQGGGLQGAALLSYLQALKAKVQPVLQYIDGAPTGN